MELLEENKTVGNEFPLILLSSDFLASFEINHQQAKSYSKLAGIVST